MKEIWEDIKDYEGLYQISNLGRVKSLQRITKLRGKGTRQEEEKELKLKKHRDGYLTVGLRKNGKRSWFTVHRLVAAAFIPKQIGKCKINHKDENKQNNMADNLEWCTTLYNNTYGNRIKKVVEKTSISVKQFDLKNKFIKEYSSISDAGRKTNTDISSISKCLNNKQKQANNYIWKKRGDAYDQ